MSKAITDVSLYLEGAAAAELVDDWALGHSEAFSSSWDELGSREVELSTNAGMEIGDVLTLWELQSNCAWSQCYIYNLDLQWRLISISENCLSEVFLKLNESIISGIRIKDLQTDKATTLSIDISRSISKRVLIFGSLWTQNASVSGSRPSKKVSKSVHSSSGFPFHTQCFPIKSTDLY